jgi:putative flavoprotein involved in K+ transport
MQYVDTVVVGAGHAGLAVSNLLSSAGHENVVLERGRVGERWRSERWDSLHLLTPNWMTRLPGWELRGPDPDGYLSATGFTDLLVRYAASFDAPVIERTAVEALSAAPDGGGFLISTDRGGWRARTVVVATGPHGAPHLPSGVRNAPLGTIEVITARRYRNPGRLPSGGVLVVGASSSGVQIADELARAGRRVVLAVGRHTRMPRRYRGMDVFWWLESTGRLARTIDQMPDATAARREPSLQLAGRNEPDRFDRNLDLATLQAAGVRLVGRLNTISDGRAWFCEDLPDTVRDAEHRMRRFLGAVDAYVERAGLAREVPAPDRPGPIDLPPSVQSLDLRAERIGTIVLATGYRPHHPWLQVPVLAADGSIQQYRGVTAASGLYVVGQRFQHRRDSGFIDGARHDAAAVVRHLIGTTVDRRRPA